MAVRQIFVFLHKKYFYIKQPSKLYIIFALKNIIFHFAITYLLLYIQKIKKTFL